MSRRLLVVVTTEVSEAALSEHVRRIAGDDAEVRVVAPASDISRLDWLTNAEDDARSDAASLARKAADAAPVADVEREVGDSDPVKAIEDALREFRADDVLVVTRPDDEASWLEEGSGQTARERFRVPVSIVTVAEDGSLAPR
jgi:nucleotide-binding universal stress UspA family protein